jgi:hypothetical protein
LCPNDDRKFIDLFFNFYGQLLSTNSTKAGETRPDADPSSIEQCLDDSFINIHTDDEQTYR